MKNVPKLRFKEFNGDWEEKRLGECVEYKKGYAFKADDYNDKGVRIIRVSDLGENSIKKENPIYISKEKAELYKEWELYPNDIIATTVGSRPPLYSSMVGKIVIVTEEFEKALLNQNSVLLRSTKNFSQKYIYNYFFRKKYINHIENIARGNANQANITLNDFFEYSIAFPSLEEQQKIADFLSSVDKKISITEEKLDLFKKYKKGIMQKIFNQELRFKDSKGNNYPEWEEKRLGDVFSFKQGYQIPFKEQIKTKEKGYVRYLYISDFFSDKNLLYVKDDGKEKITETDITVANTGNTAGSFYRGKSGILSNNMFNIQNDEKVVTNDFLFQFLGTSLYSNQLKTFFNSSGQPHLGHKNMSMIIINYPVSFEEQQKIVDFLSSIDNKIDNLTSELEDLKEFKKGLLQQMFV